MKKESKFMKLILETNYSLDLPFKDNKKGCSEPNCTCNMFKKKEREEENE